MEIGKNLPTDVYSCRDKEKNEFYFGKKKKRKRRKKKKKKRVLLANSFKLKRNKNKQKRCYRVYYERVFSNLFLVPTKGKAKRVC